VDAPLALAAVSVLVLAATAIGVVWRARAGRARVAKLDDAIDLRELGIPANGAAVNIVQFSTEYCARCPGVHRALVAMAAEEPGVAVSEIDLTHRADLASRFRVLQTPTVVVLTSAGTEAARFAGAVRPESLRHLLARLKGANDGLVA
jgi:thiol-disulfide isomerase/thioredoxin